MLGAGSTIYMDPEPTVALNNAEAMLSGQEEEEEARILAALSALVAAQSARIWEVSLPASLLTDSVPCIKHGWCCKPFCVPDSPVKLAGYVRHSTLIRVHTACTWRFYRDVTGYWLCADTQCNNSAGRLRRASRACSLVRWEAATLSGA